MATAALGAAPRSIPRATCGDALFVALAGIHGVVLAAWPSVPLIALGLWWGANTVSHNFIHRPFFRGRLGNALFSAYLSVLLGFPQSVWRERHLAHHAGSRWRPRLRPQNAVEACLVLTSWVALASVAPRFFLTVFVPGYLLGLGLCTLQGFYEHEPGVTSHYGRLYNLLCFNDGYHAEHHARPGVPWNRLPARMEPGARTSRWPALLRWLDGVTLDALERRVLRSAQLQRFVLRAHRRAFQALLPAMPASPRVTIIGGGLFPRTSMILSQLRPDARIRIVDASAGNLETARPLCGSRVELVHRRYSPRMPLDCDLLVVPLAFDGDREEIYRNPPASAVVVHDWVWRRRGRSRLVSLLLLKRLNLITQRVPQ